MNIRAELNGCKSSFGFFISPSIQSESMSTLATNALASVRVFAVDTIRFASFKSC